MPAIYNRAFGSYYSQRLMEWAGEYSAQNDYAEGEAIPSWGFVGVGQCFRCSHLDHLWVWSGSIGNGEPKCMECSLYVLEYFRGDNGSAQDREIAWLAVRNPNTLDLEPYDSCGHCSRPVISSRELTELSLPSRFNPIEVIHGDSTAIVHQGCSFNCPSCNRTYSYGTGAMISYNGEDVCGGCFDEALENNGGTLTECRNCNTHTDNPEYFNGHEYCEPCYDSYATTCDECCEEYFGNGWDDHECYEEDESPYIHNYSYKPRPFFFGEGKYHLGFELEVEAHNTYPSTGAQRVVQLLGERAYCKEDGSLNKGFEIVTHPHTLEEYHSKFNWSILEELRTNSFRSWDTDTCGLHVHVSRTAFGEVNSSKDILKVQAHELRFMKLIYDNERQVQRIAGRSASRYATFEDKGSLIRKVKTGQQNNGRYSAVNTENSETLEVRVFRGSLRKERVLSAIEFVTAAVEYTRDLKVAGENQALSWLRFVSFVAQNYEQYPNLAGVIEKTFQSERVVEAR